MAVLSTVLIVMAVLAYLGIGFVIARAIGTDSIDGFTWWQGILVMLLWPLIPLLFLLAFMGWVKDGSH